MGSSTSIVFYLRILAILSLTTRSVPAVAQEVDPAIIGYDCDTQIENLTTISIVDIDDCDLQIDNVKTSFEDIALLELNEYEHLEVFHCKVEITRKVFYCGMSSHNSISYVTYIHDISRDACRTAHQDNIIWIGQQKIANLKVNATQTQSIVLAGMVDNNGTCIPDRYSDPYGSWPRVIAKGSAEITLKTAVVRADVASDNIFLSSQFKCKLSRESCIGPNGGRTFWNAIPRRQCSKNTYSKLYSGNATKFESTAETVYSVNVDETSFSMKVIGSEVSCGVEIYKTESPKLFIMKYGNVQSMEDNIVDMHTNNLGLFQYANAKFLYVERYVRTQPKKLYLDVIQHFCKLEKDMLKNVLAIVSTQPDVFALRYMEDPGYMAVLTGEVVRIVKCVPVKVKLSHTGKCYTRLPVLRGNDTVFLMPRTRIISNYATEIKCSWILPETYKLIGTWYKLCPSPHPAVEPMILKPSSKMTWNYENPANLVISGIYHQDDIKSMSQRILNTLDRTIFAESVAEQLTDGMGGPISFSNLFNKGVTEELAESIWSKTWGMFTVFGTTCAGLIGIFVCLSLFKTVANSIYNGFKLYRMFGCSVHLLGAVTGDIQRKQMDIKLPTTTLNLDTDEDVENGTEHQRPTQFTIDDNPQEPIPAPRRLCE